MYLMRESKREEKRIKTGITTLKFNINFLLDMKFELMERKFEYLTNKFEKGKNPK